MALSFPYPKNGDVNRPAGQGCTTCVNSVNCQALYWFKRYGQRDIDEYNGIACLSWSDDEIDRITTRNEDDDAYVEKMYSDEIDSEPNRCGITDEVTGSSRERHVY